jgi:hypothetical protein
VIHAKSLAYSASERALVQGERRYFVARRSPDGSLFVVGSPLKLTIVFEDVIRVRSAGARHESIPDAWSGGFNRSTQHSSRSPRYIGEKGQIAG